MRSVLALIGYVVLLGGVLGVLILGGLWASSRFLGDPPSGNSGSSIPVEESVASTSGGDEVSTGTGPGEPDAGGPDAGGPDTGEAAAGEAATGAGNDAAQPSSAEDGKEAEPVPDGLKPAQLTLDVTDSRGRRLRGARVSIVPRDLGGEPLQLFLRLSGQEWASIPEGVNVARDSQGRRPSRPLADRSPDRSLVPGGFALEVVAWSEDGSEVAMTIVKPIKPGNLQKMELSLAPLKKPEDAEAQEAEEGGGKSDAPESPDRFISVRGPDGRPLQRAVVESGRTQGTAVAKGLFRVRLEGRSGRYVRISAKGLGSRCLSLGEEGRRPDEPVVVVLSPPSGLRVSVTQGGEPLAGLRVRAIEFSEEMELGGERLLGAEAVVEGRTDESGKVLLAGLPSGQPLAVEVSQGRQLLVRLQETTLLEAEELRELELGLSMEGVSLGTLKDAQGEPVGGVELWLLDAQGDLRRRRYITPAERPDRRAFTGIDGSYRIQVPAPGLWWIGVAPPPLDEERDLVLEDAVWSPLAMRLEVSEQDHAAGLLPPVELTAVPPLRLGGTVILAAIGDEPVTPGEGLTVVASSVEYGTTFETVVGRSGRFSFGGLAPGHFSLDIVGEEAGASVRVEGGAWQVAGDEGIRIYVGRGGG